MRRPAEQKPGERLREKAGTIDRLRRSRRGRRAPLANLAFLVAAGLFLAAVVLLAHYAQQAASLRNQLEELRQASLPAGDPLSAQRDDGLASADSTGVQRDDGLASADSTGAQSDEGLAAADSTGTQRGDGLAAADGGDTGTTSGIAGPKTTPAPPARDFGALHRRNADIAAWLLYPGLREIDLPVVQRDNEFYMTHDYLGRKNVSGSIFADQRNTFSPRDTNLVLYGHNMKNGTMFGKLYRLVDNRLLGDSPFFSLETPEGSELYIPYAVALVDDEPDMPRYFPVATLNFRDEADMLSYAEGLRAFSEFQFPVSVEGGDRLLTLVTCHGESDSERLVVALRAVRPGEDADSLRAMMRQAF